jgi:hypothetical protein
MERHAPSENAMLEHGSAQARLALPQVRDDGGPPLARWPVGASKALKLQIRR